MNNSKGFRHCFATAVLVVSVLFLAGCKDINGGGFIKKADGGKATFGFQLKCRTDEAGAAQVSGQIQFNDHDEKIRLHAVPDSVPMDQCADNSENADIVAEYLQDNPDVSYSGTYIPQPKKLGPGGRFEVTLRDTGESGKEKGDYFSITLTGGIYDGYHEEGVLKGGNLKTK